jgi:hypothetical protein
MASSPIVRTHDQKTHGEFRTKRLIIEIFDTLAEPTRTDTHHQTRLNPPPADPAACHQTRASF